MNFHLLYTYFVILQEKVWGVAYEIPPSEEERVRAHLDHREKGGYASVSVTFHPEDNTHSPFDLEIYIGTEENPFYLGPADIQDIAKQIYQSEGPSGKNTEYLFELASAMKQLVPHAYDDHLFTLEHEVRRLCEQNLIVKSH